MTVTFELGSDRPLELIGFAWSPLLEAVLSLPVITHPKRTPMHLPWARRCRDLPPDLLDEIQLLAGAPDGFVAGIFEVGLACDRPAFDEELARFVALDDEVFTYELSLVLGGIGCGGLDSLAPDVVHDPAYRRDVVAVAGTSDPRRADLAAATFDDPQTVKERIATMLERYWRAAFHDEWQRVLPRIEAEVTHGARALVMRGVPGLVDELLPEGRWDERSQSIVVAKRHDGRCDVAARGGMLLVPSVYAWPRVLIELATPWPVAITFPLRDLRTPQVPLASDHDVATGLRALGDETRLQIARMVAEQPRSTRELAELLQLSDSAVSRHLKILDAAGVVAGERDGYFVLYQLRPERISRLGGALRRTLGLAQAPPGTVPPLPVTLSRPLSATVGNSPAPGERL